MYIIGQYSQPQSCKTNRRHSSKYILSSLEYLWCLHNSFTTDFISNGTENDSYVDHASPVESVVLAGYSVAIEIFVCLIKYY